jgi:class 3 adenylate cyclase
VPLGLADTAAVAGALAEFVTGARPVLPSDRVLATVLFTDIVDSTLHAAAMGDRSWHEILDDYDAAAAGALADFRGRQVKTTGDGTLATFDGPARAIRCAIALSDAVSQLGVQLRAGLHTGEVETRGVDIAGIAVHIGQRISALAGPGEVLVSRTVKDLVAGSGLTFTDRGTHKLKGIPEDWQVYAAER